MTRIKTALMAQGFGTRTKNISLSGYISKLSMTRNRKTAMYYSALISHWSRVSLKIIGNVAFMWKTYMQLQKIMKFLLVSFAFKTLLFIIHAVNILLTSLIPHAIDALPGKSVGLGRPPPLGNSRCCSDWSKGNIITAEVTHVLQFWNGLQEN
jgi:hypothetical protein